MKENKTIYIGEMLKRLRIAKQLSQEELAYRSGFDRTYISSLERNISQPSLGTTFALAEALGLKPYEFVKEILKSMDRDLRTNRNLNSLGNQ